MKLIALRDFRNVPGLRLKDDEGKSLIDKAIHDDHIHKGAQFEIGRAKDLDEMRKTDKQNAEFVAQLFMAGSVGDANDPKVVKAVEDEIAVDVKRAETATKLNKEASLQAAGQAVVDALKPKT